MTPEERFEQLESNMNRLEVWLEEALQGHHVRLQKLEELQVVLMESQNSAWRAMERLERNIEKFLQGPRPNGHEN